MNTIGAHAEFILREYLARSGLTRAEADQVTLVVVPPVTSEQALRQKQTDVATLQGVLRDKALSRGGLRKLFSDFDLVGKFTAGTYVFRHDFIRENPRTVRKFVEATAKAIEWARSHPRDEVIARYEAIIKRRGRNEDASAIPFWRSTGIASAGGVIAESEFRVWLDWLVKAGQLGASQIKLDDLYTNEFNPYRNNPSPT